MSHANQWLSYEIDKMDISQNSWAVQGCGAISFLEPNRKNRERKRERRSLRRRFLQEGAEGEEVPPSCPFVHKQFPTYSYYPCDAKDPSTGEIACDFEADDLSSFCEDVIAKHCYWYYTKEKKCVDYLDLLLIADEPTTNGECNFKTITPDGINALRRMVTEGRDGKGIIIVFASGNENRVGDDTNFQGYGSNSRYTISVAGVGKNGMYSDYSTQGASVFISAPAGDPRTAHTTVIGATNGGKCKDGGTGTSWAAPGPF